MGVAVDDRRRDAVGWLLTVVREYEIDGCLSGQPRASWGCPEPPLRDPFEAG